MTKYILILVLLSRYLYGIEIHGKITSSETGLPLSDVNIYFMNGQTGTISDQDGEYHLTIQAGQNYSLVFDYVGYFQEKREIESQGNDIELNISLRPNPYEISGIVVEESRDENNSYQNYKLTAEKMDNMPGVMEADVIRSVAVLPGIFQYNDLKSDVSLHGSPPDQTQFLYDEMEIYHPWHLFGVFGPINSDVIREVTAYSSGFPARLGGRAGGVIDIYSKDHPEQKEVKLNISLLSSSFYYNHRLNKLGFLFSVRKTYFDIASNLVYPIPFGFIDGNLKLTYFLSPNLNFQFTSAFNNDFFTTKVEEYTGHEGFPSFKKFLRNFFAGEQNWGNRAIGWRANYYKNNLGFELFYYNSFYYMKFPYAVENHLDDHSFKIKARYRFSENLTINAGQDLKFLNSEYKWSSSQDDLNEVYPALSFSMDKEEKSKQLSVWSDLNYIWNGHHIQPGIRFNLSGQKIYQEERVSYVKAISPTTEIRSGYGRYIQFLYAPFSNTGFAIGSPVVSIEKPTTVFNYSVGLSKRINPLLQADIDFYYKKLLDLPINQDNENYMPERRTGSVYGADLFFIKSKGYFTWQFTYTYNKSLGKLENKTFPLSWDVSHRISFLSGLAMRKGWYSNLGVYFNSGLPYTPVISSTYGQLNGSYNYGRRFLYGEFNSARYPDYLRVDFSVRKLYAFQTFDLFFKFQVINLFYRQNILGVNWFEYYFNVYGDKDRQGIIYGLPVLPSIGVEFYYK